jgi:CspA family cold shock protein
VRQNGRVKWYNASRGVGCIASASGEEIGVVASAIVRGMLPGLEEGQTVEFDVARGPDGPQAERVVPIGEATE